MSQELYSFENLKVLFVIVWLPQQTIPQEIAEHFQGVLPNYKRWASWGAEHCRHSRRIPQEIKEKLAISDSSSWADTSDFKGTFATASTAAKLYFLPVSRGLQNISDSQKHSRVPYYISVLLDQNNTKRSLADAHGRKTNCSRKKDAWWSSGGQTACTAPMWNFSCPLSEEQLLHWACTARQESLLSISHHGTNSWHRAGRLPLPDRAETHSCLHIFRPFRAALKNKKQTLLDCCFSILIKSSQTLSKKPKMLEGSLACTKLISAFFFSAFSFSATALAAPSSGSASTVVSLQHPSLHALLNCLKFRGTEHLGLQWNLMRSVVASSPLPHRPLPHRTSFEDANCYPLSWLPYYFQTSSCHPLCWQVWLLNVKCSGWRHKF